MLQPVPEGYNVLNFVGFTDCGEYSQSSTYAKNDIVHKDNAAWLCLTDGTVGITPEEGKNWTIFIASENNSSGITTVDTKGIVGPAGENVSNQEIIDKLAERTINEEQKSENIVSMLSDAFSDEKTYFIGDYAIYENTLYRFTAEKTAGVWNPTVAEAVTVAGELDKLNGNMPKIFNGYVNFKITDREQPISVTFPQAFSEIPSVIGMVKRSGYANQTFWTLTAVNKTSATFYVTTGGNTANNADCTLYWIAVGR